MQTRTPMIVRAIIAMAHSLNLLVLAEGSSGKLNELSCWMRGATMPRGISLGHQCRRTSLTPSCLLTVSGKQASAPCRSRLTQYHCE